MHFANFRHQFLQKPTLFQYLLRNVLTLFENCLGRAQFFYGDAAVDVLSNNGKLREGNRKWSVQGNRTGSMDSGLPVEQDRESFSAEGPLMSLAHPHSIDTTTENSKNYPASGSISAETSETTIVPEGHFLQVCTTSAEKSRCWTAASSVSGQELNPGAPLTPPDSAVSPYSPSPWWTISHESRKQSNLSLGACSDDSNFPEIDYHVMVVSHGGLIREFIRRLCELSPGTLDKPTLLRSSAPNTGVSRFMVKIEEQTVSSITCLEVHNKDHLILLPPPDKKTAESLWIALNFFCSTNLYQKCPNNASAYCSLTQNFIPFDKPPFKSYRRSGFILKGFCQSEPIYHVLSSFWAPSQRSIEKIKPHGRY